MADKKKDTKLKVFMADEELLAMHSNSATWTLVFCVVWFVSVVGAFGLGHCHAKPACRQFCVDIIQAFVPGKGRDGHVASAATPNFAPRARPQPVLAASSSRPVTPTPPDARDEYERAQRHLLAQVFDAKRWQTTVQLGEAHRQADPDGTYTVRVPVSWSIDPAPLLGVLNQYFSDVNGLPLRVEDVDFSGKLTHESRGIVISRQFNRDDAQKLPYTERLFDWLCRQQLQLVVSLGAVESRLTVASGRDCFVTCDGHGNRLFQLHVEHASGGGGLVFSNKHDEYEPVVLRGVPASALGEPIELRVERREPATRRLDLARNKAGKL